LDEALDGIWGWTKRRDPNDAVTLADCDARVLSLGALACAAVGKNPAYSPTELLNMVSRMTVRTQAEYNEWPSCERLDAAVISRRLHEANWRALEFVQRLPEEALGCFFLDGDAVVEPDIDRLGSYRRREVSPDPLLLSAVLTS
jgi:hypothetical protein